MTLNELEKRGRLRKDGQFKRQVVGSLLLGFADSQTICQRLKISRTLLRSWLRWDYRHRVFKYIQPTSMKEETKVSALKKRIEELETALEKEQIRREAYEILVDIGLEKYGIDLRKKTGAKR